MFVSDEIGIIRLNFLKMVLKQRLRARNWITSADSRLKIVI